MAWASWAQRAAAAWNTSSSTALRCRYWSERSARPLAASAPSSRRTTDYIEWLLQTARSYIYTTALPPPVAAAARAALAVAAADSWRRERVLALAARLRQGCAQAGIALLPSPSPIQPVVLGDSARALAVSEQLFAAGFLGGGDPPAHGPQGLGTAADHPVRGPQ